MENLYRQSDQSRPATFSQKHGLCPFRCSGVQGVQGVQGLGIIDILAGQKGDQGGGPKMAKIQHGQNRTSLKLPCFRSLSSAWGFSTKCCTASFNGTKSNSLILWTKCFPVSARSHLSWAKYESLMQADLYRVARFLFRIGLCLPSPVVL